MKTFIRTTITTTLIIFSVLSIWSYIRQSNALTNVQAAPKVPVPAHCTQPELLGIQELISKAPNSNAAQPLLEKKKALEQAELDCVARAGVNRPAQKPKSSVGVLLPTSSPVATPVLQLGIQSQELLPIGTFLPTSDGPNIWVDIIKGKVVEIAAGSLREEDENWRQNHPEWVTQGPQGALYIIINREGSNGIIYPTPSRNGSVFLVSSCGNLLSLKAADGTTFSFDVISLSYVENAIPCLAP